jgi:tryptophan synthase alpha chain
MSALADTLSQIRSDGWKAFLPYVTAGLPQVDAPFLRALEEAGADALEVGVPFSDPMMDGPVIQEASRRALAAGTTAERAMGLVREARLGIPVVFMTYLNPILSYGQDRFVAEAAAAGVSGVIVPDLPVDEAESWLQACRRRDVSPVLLAAPNSSTERLKEIAAASGGFVYCVSTNGVTGARDSLAGSAREVVAALRPLTETPLMVGVGISSPDQARVACAFADGVVVGTALVGPLLEGDTAGCLELARGFRAAANES